MSFALKLVLCTVIGYLLGSANSSLIVGKFYGVDVRKHGSGNAGATNTLRTLGKTAAILTILGDVLKGVLACLIGSLLMYGTDQENMVGLMSAGMGAIIGHNWPVYFRFKGGKGVLTSFTVAMMMDWKISLGLFAVFVVIVLITRYISLGSIISAALFPIAGLIFIRDGVFVAFALLLGGLIIIRHHANIGRIFKGTESKFGAKKAV